MLQAGRNLIDSETGAPRGTAISFWIGTPNTRINWGRGSGAVGRTSSGYHHDHGERNHQGLDNREVGTARRSRDSVLSFYCREAV